MADETLTINNADGSSKTYTINRDKFAGVRSMQVNGQTVTVDRTAVPKKNKTVKQPLGELKVLLLSET